MIKFVFEFPISDFIPSLFHFQKRFNGSYANARACFRLASGTRQISSTTQGSLCSEEPRTERATFSTTCSFSTFGNGAGLRSVQRPHAPTSLLRIPLTFRSLARLRRLRLLRPYQLGQWTIPPPPEQATPLWSTRTIYMYSGGRTTRIFSIRSIGWISAASNGRASGSRPSSSRAREPSTPQA